MQRRPPHACTRARAGPGSEKKEGRRQAGGRRRMRTLGLGGAAGRRQAPPSLARSDRPRRLTLSKETGNMTYRSRLWSSRGSASAGRARMTSAAAMIV